MSDPDWAHPFPAGVTDAAGQHALITDASGHGIVLRLADGRRLWRSDEPVRPLLVDEGLAIALSFAPPRVVARSLRGDERWRSLPLPWPDWALRLPQLDPASDLHAAWLDGDVLLSWRLRAPRSGGAGRSTMPPPVISEGGCRLQRDSGAWQALADPPWPPEDQAGGNASDDPQVLAQGVIAGKRYALIQRREAGRLHIALQAQGLEAAKSPDWISPIDDIEAESPRPPRP